MPQSVKILSMIGSWQAYEVDLPVGFAVSFAIRELFKNRPHLRPVFPLREYEMMPFIKIYQMCIRDRRYRADHNDSTRDITALFGHENASFEWPDSCSMCGDAVFIHM